MGVALDAEARQAAGALWDTLSESGASNVEETLEHALRSLCELVNAQNAYWMGAVRMAEPAEEDAVGGWRYWASLNLDSAPDREAIRREHVRRLDEGAVDPCIVANLRGAGTFRINIQHEHVPDGWYDSEFYQSLSAPFGIRDVIFAATPLGSDVESWFVFERIGERAALFGEAERERLDYAVRPLRWFHRQLALHHGMQVATEPLKPFERRVLSQLLTERTEREIAEVLELSPSTVHTYCTRICRKFNVRGRAGLTALWLGRPGAEPA